MKKPISDAVVLMAGSGSRLVAGGHVLPKPLVRIGGRAVFSYTVDALKAAGIKTLHVVTGRNRDQLLPGLTELVPAGIKLNPIHNPESEKQNGLSVLVTAPYVSTPFLLAMGDHLFKPSVVDLLLREAKPNELNVAIDRKLDSIFDPDDAMKAQTRGDRLIAIGKGLENYDAVDIGLFVCPTEFFDYLERSKCNDDCSLADGVRAMATGGKVHAIDIGDAWWQDIDTPEMLAAAEKVLRASPNLLTPSPAAP